MKTIAVFYTKAKSPEHLAAVYEACAQAEIDECRDYKRAISAMQVLPSASFSAEISVTSPRKIFSFIVYKNYFWIKVSKRIVILVLKTEALVLPTVNLQQCLVVDFDER